MWALRILSGPRAGQWIELQSGANKVGRSENCHIQLQSNGVSKEHAQLLVSHDQVMVSDLKSSNGTFVNGIRVQNHKLKAGDKISFHDVFCDLVSVPHTAHLPKRIGSSSRAAHQQTEGNLALQPSWHTQAASSPPESLYMQAQQQTAAPASAPPMTAENLQERFFQYLDTVAMPGIYKMAQSFEYRWALSGFLALYILTVALLSISPMISLVRESIQNESGRRARTIARNLAQVNRQAVIENMELSLSTRIAELEEGVRSAYLVSAKDGHILAPATERGNAAKRAFVSRTRKEDRGKEDREIIENLDDTTVGASVPITYYDSQMGKATVAAYAVVLYDIGSLGISSSQSLSLFIQTITISALLGLILLFFLIRLVEHPLRQLNIDLDEALRDARDDLKTPYQFPVLQALVSNINSALSRMNSSSSHGGGPNINYALREAESQNITQAMQEPCLAVSALDQRILAHNTAFHQLIGGSVHLVGRPLTEIPDSSLQQNILDLLPLLRAQPDVPAHSSIPFPDGTYKITAVSVLGVQDPIYFLINFQKDGGHE